MLIQRLVPLAALALSASAMTINVDLPPQVSIRDDNPDNPLKVPGENPLEFCSPQDDFLLTIKKVDLDPNPPQAGKTLTIKATGKLNSRIEKGAYVNLQVKYGLITLVKQTVDLCEQVSNVDLECPLEAGDLDLVKDVELPNQIPPGKYTVLADVFTVDDEHVTCLKATVSFGLNRQMFHLEN